MELATITYIVVGLSFAVYIVIAIAARAGSTQEFYVAGGGIHPVANGMATAGSGDVLTGIISGFIAQGVKPLEAAILGVYFHGKAGEAAASKFGDAAMISGDIISHINIPN